MKILFVTIGEPVIHPKNELRLHRTGLLCELISKNGLAEVTWITSSFNHFNKEFYEKNDLIYNVNKNLQIVMFKGVGYTKNISIKRFIDHYIIQLKYRRFIKNLNSYPDVVITSYPTIGLCYESVDFFTKKKIPVYIDYRDMWPEVFYKILPKNFLFFSKLIFYPLKLLAGKTIKNAHAIISISDSLLEYVLKSYRRNRKEIDFVSLMAFKKKSFRTKELESTYSFFKKSIPGLLETRNSINFIFLGTFSKKGYNFYPILDELDRLESDFKIILCGSGSEEINLKKKYNKNKNFFFPGYLNDKQINVLLKNSDVGLCPYSESDDFQNTIPSKSSVYFSEGLLCLSSIRKGDFPILMNDNKLGFTYNSNDSKSVENAVISTINFIKKSQHNKKSIIDFFENNFNSDKVYYNYFKKIQNDL